MSVCTFVVFLFFFSSRRRHTRWPRDWSSDVCSSDLQLQQGRLEHPLHGAVAGLGGPAMEVGAVVGQVQTQADPLGVRGNLMHGPDRSAGAPAGRALAWVPWPA